MDNEIFNWLKYESVRRSGKYNMIMEGARAAKEARLSLQDYTKIIKRYSIIKDKIEKRYTKQQIEDFISDLARWTLN